MMPTQIYTLEARNLRLYTLARCIDWPGLVYICFYYVIANHLISKLLIFFCKTL